jgi:hypothetical protein
MKVLKLNDIGAEALECFTNLIRAMRAASPASPERLRETTEVTRRCQSAEDMTGALVLYLTAVHGHWEAGDAAAAMRCDESAAILEATERDEALASFGTLIRCLSAERRYLEQALPEVLEVAARCRADAAWSAAKVLYLVAWAGCERLADAASGDAEVAEDNALMDIGTPPASDAAVALQQHRYADAASALPNLVVQARTRAAAKGLYLLASICCELLAKPEAEVSAMTH